MQTGGGQMEKYVLRGYKKLCLYVCGGCNSGDVWNDIDPAHAFSWLLSNNVKYKGKDFSYFWI